MGQFDDFIQFINTEMPKRSVVLRGENCTGDPNLSAVSYVNNAPVGTFYMQYDDNNELWQKKTSSSDGWFKTSVTFTNEQVEDIIGNALQSGENVSITYDDDGNQIIISANDTHKTDEEIQTIVNDMITSGDNISLNFNSETNTLSISAIQSDLVNKKDIVFMLGDDLILGVQKASELWIPYTGIIDDILVSIGESSSHDSNIIFEVQKFNTFSWSTLGTYELQVSDRKKTFTADYSIDNDKLRIVLISGDVVDLSNMCVIAKMTVTP